MTNDQILERIARFHFPKGPVIAERRNRGYTLFHANTGAPIARLRPFGPDDRVELLYWSSWKEKLGADGTLRPHRPAARPGAPRHCKGGNLLDARTILTKKNAQSRAEGIAWIQSRVSEDPLMSRQRLAREVCEHFGWRDVLGRPKEMACRKYLLQFQRRALVQLPPARYQAQPRRRRTCAVLQDVPHCSGTLADLGRIELQAVARRRAGDALMEAHHPQGSGPLCGAQMRYLIRSATVGAIGGLAVSAPAWRLAARDEQRCRRKGTGCAGCASARCRS
jgi:hypothetical protein